MAAEQLKTSHIGCIGRDVPVLIDVNGESTLRDGSVTVLDPNQEINNGVRGLFLDGAVLSEPIKRVLIVNDGTKNVFKHVRVSYNPWDMRSNFIRDVVIINMGKRKDYKDISGGRIAKIR